MTQKQGTKKQTSLLSFFSTPPGARKPELSQDAGVGNASPRTPDVIATPMANVVLSDVHSPAKRAKTVEARVGGLVGAVASKMQHMDDEELCVTPRNRAYAMLSDSDGEDAAPIAAPPLPGGRAGLAGAFAYDEGRPVDPELPVQRVVSVQRGGDEDAPAQEARYAWLLDVRDAQGRRRGEPGYDARTLHVPRDAWARMTPFERQFWEIKARLFDTVVFFKKGKFYELYEEDADVAAREFDLKVVERVNMRMAGVPEATYDVWAGRFVAAGYKIARVDQAETAIGKEIREREAREAAGGRRNAAPRDKIIARELTCVLTAGTVSEPAMLPSDRANYCLALVLGGVSKGSTGSSGGAERLCELGNGGAGHGLDNGGAGHGLGNGGAGRGLGNGGAGRGLDVGVAAVDASSGRFLAGDVYEVDPLSGSTLETVLLQLQPRELLLFASNAAAEAASTVVRRLAAQMRCAVVAVQPDECWSPQQIRDACPEGGVPPVLESVLLRGGPASRALGVLLAYLSTLRIDRTLLSAGVFAPYDPARGCCASDAALCPEIVSKDAVHTARAASEPPAVMHLDGQALQDLEILPGPRCARKDTLLALVDRCATAGGRRLLETWLSAPLADASAISARLDVVDFFLGNDQAPFSVQGGSLQSPEFPSPCSSAAHGGRSVAADVRAALAGGLAGLPDIERVLARIHAGTVRVRDFVGAVDALLRVRTMLGSVASLLARDPSFAVPKLLMAVLDAVPDYSAQIDGISAAYAREEALRDGAVQPLPGADAEYDAALASLARIRTDLDTHLAECALLLGTSPGALRFRDIGKEPFQVEVPEGASSREPPASWMLTSRTKAVRRFYAPATRTLVREWLEWDERRAAASRSFYARLLRRVDEDAPVWRAVAAALARLDALLALAKASEGLAHPRCRPVLVDAPAAAVHCRELRHPTASALGRAFVPNDVTLGTLGDECAPRAVLLTGPNMGGKSTLLRQTCLAVVLAQLGCYVPAASCVIAGPVDRVFTRLGAHDNIVGGQSTFMVELLDAAKILRHATPRSLAIVDELGRGTSTHDGMAIAQAVLCDLAIHRRPLVLFATHYRPLAALVCSPADPDACAPKSILGDTACMHMACNVDDAAGRVTFLYRLAPGVSPRSFGTHVARLAGVPESVVADAEASIASYECGGPLSGIADGECASPADNASSQPAARTARDSRSVALLPEDAEARELYARLVALLCLREA